MQKDEPAAKKEIEGIQYSVFVSGDSEGSGDRTYFEQKRIYVEEYGLTFWIYENEIYVINETEMSACCVSQRKVNISVDFLNEARTFLTARDNLNKHIGKWPFGL